MIKKHIQKIILCLALVLSLPISLQAHADVPLNTTWYDLFKNKINSVFYARKTHVSLFFAGALGLGWLILVMVNMVNKANNATVDKNKNNFTPKNNTINTDDNTFSFKWDKKLFAEKNTSYYENINNCITQAINNRSYKTAYDILNSIKNAKEGEYASSFNSSLSWFNKQYVTTYLELALKKEYKKETEKDHFQLIDLLIKILRIDNTQTNILIFACSHKNNLPLVDYLIKKHNITPSPEIRCKDTPLGICIVNNFYDIAMYLLKKNQQKQFKQQKNDGSRVISIFDSYKKADCKQRLYRAQNAYCIIGCRMRCKAL